MAKLTSPRPLQTPERPTPPTPENPIPESPPSPSRPSDPQIDQLADALTAELRALTPQIERLREELNELTERRAQLLDQARASELRLHPERLDHVIRSVRRNRLT